MVYAVRVGLGCRATPIRCDLSDAHQGKERHFLMRANEPAITVTDLDLERLLPIIDTNDTPAAELLDWELRRAKVVPHGSVDRDLVTMNTDVVYEDLETGERKTVRVVYPKDANVALGHVSVLAPIGSALLGLRVGQTIEWSMPKGKRRLVVREVHAPR